MSVSVFGGFLTVIGLIVPSSLLIRIVVGGAIDAQKELIGGATLFKVGLVLQGLFVIMLGRMSIWKSERQKKESFSEQNSMFVSVILVIILVIAVIMRLYKLDAGLWYDEILTYVYYMDRSLGEIITTYNDQNNHFLYTILARLSFFVFGPSVWSLRLPAVLFGVGSIWALYLFSSSVATRREGLLGAALLAFSYHHVWFSQNARGYTGLLFWTLLSSWLLVRSLRDGRSQFWPLYGFSAALGIYTHMTMIFVVIGHFTVYVMSVFGRCKDERTDWWVGMVAGFVFAGFVAFQLHAFVLPQVLGGTLWQGAQGTVTMWTDPVWMLVELVKGMNRSFSGSIVGIIACLVFFAGLADFWRKEPMVVWLLVVPPVLGMMVMMTMGYTLFPRFIFFTLGYGVIILIRGTMRSGYHVSHILRLGLTTVPLVGSTLCFGLISASAITVPLAYAPKQDYQGALQFVEEKKEESDAVVTVGLTALPYKRLYNTNWHNVDNVQTLNFIRSRTKRTWLLYTLPIHVESVYPDIMASIRRDFKVVRRFYGTLEGGTIWVCRSDAPPS